MTKLGFILGAVLLSAPAFGQAPDPSVREIGIRIDERDRQYSQRFDAQEKAVAAALAAAKEAVTKAEAAAEKRFDSVNEFRNTLKDQTATFLTRGEAIGFFFGACGLAVGVVGLLLRKRAAA